MCFAHLRATTACTFLTSQLPKVVRIWCALYILTSKCALRHNAVVRTWCVFACFCILTWKCASCHNGVHFFDISTSKSGPNVRCFVMFCDILTWKCASCHTGVHFLDIATSKSGPDLVCFVHFDLEMCFAPQRRALFHLSSGQMAPHPPL